MIAKIACDSIRLDQLKPTQIKHQFKMSPDASTGGLKVNSTVYKNKLRPDQVCQIMCLMTLDLNCGIRTSV